MEQKTVDEKPAGGNSRPTICYPARRPELKFEDWFFENAMRLVAERESMSEKQWAREGWNAAIEAASYVIGTDGSFAPESETELAIEQTRRELAGLVREVLIAG